jgi:hypothetical protein
MIGEEIIFVIVLIRTEGISVQVIMPPQLFGLGVKRACMKFDVIRKKVNL